MTPEERHIRLIVGIEIIENVILDFLEENSGSYFSSFRLHNELSGIPYETCNEMLRRLHEQGRIADHKGPDAQRHKWQAL